MSFAETITEPQATALAGVSARTLRRFQESGYLEISIGGDGEARYVRSQILEIFGAADALSTRAQETEAPEDSSTQTCSATSPSEEGSISVESPTSEHSESTDSSTAFPTAETARLRNLVDLQERILDMKDKEIADLRSQRDWLRSRVERLEEKSERDQILLLSETQTIRKLVSLQEGRKSAFQNILEWLGISKQPELRQITGPEGYSNADAVEVKGTAANA